MDKNLVAIEEKVQRGERLTHDDGLKLFQSNDLQTIGRMANLAKERLHGKQVYYNVNRHFAYSNVCVLSCKFCDFYRRAGDEGAYEHDMEAIAAEAERAKEAGATELHSVGGLHPKLKFEYYLDMLRTIKSVYPEIHIKAFTAVEISHFARRARQFKQYTWVLEQLRDAGLGSLPGGGAEIFDDRLHDEAFKGKIRSDQWAQVHREAHEIGLMSNATILYGHIESYEDRLHHLLMLRDLQDEAIENNHTGRFQTVIPLSFVPGKSELNYLPGPTGLDDLKMLAISRLMLDNFSHVKAFWIMQTIELAQLSLQYGVDDIDGTVVWYDITKTKGDGDTHQELSVRELRNFVREAGYVPIERDTLYRPVKRDGAKWWVEEAATV